MKHLDWIKARKNLLETVKKQVHMRLGSPPKDLKAYQAARDREFQKKWTSTENKDLVQRLEASDLIFLGDFHAYYQSQRAHVRLLRQIDLSDAAVFCEFLRAEDQLHIDRYLRDQISEAEFLERVRWAQNWEFPWEHYRPLMTFLKERQVTVFGLSAAASLDRELDARDKKMAALMEQRLGHELFGRVIVIVGDMHLAPSHLPAQVEKIPCLKFETSTTVFQDVDSLYFEHVGKGPLAEGQVLKRGSLYCWYVSPPWVKWQSYLIYLERMSDTDFEDEEEDLALEDHIKAFVLWLTHDFNLKVSPNAIEVLTPQSNDRLRQKVPASVFQHLVEGDRSFLIGASGAIYLSRLSVNHGANVAGQYIHAQLSGRRENFFKMPDELLQRVWMEIVGYFFSKRMNPNRKVEDFESLKIRLNAFGGKRELRQTLSLVSEIYLVGQGLKRTGKLKEKALRRSLKIYPLRAQLEASRYLARIFGRGLYEGVRAGKISEAELKEWLSKPLESKDFDSFFWRTIAKIL